MASQCSRVRAVAAGLSCGIGLAVPALAFAATLPFDGAHRAVVSSALPLAVGMLAGTGVTTLSAWAIEHHALRRAEEEVSSSGFEAETTQSADDDDIERFFGGHRAPKGVPVIARAQGAPREDEAWAEIDAMLDEDSPISCDPRYSKDIYEIAFEELRRESARGAGAAQAGEAAAAASAGAATGPASGAPSAASIVLSPESATAVFMALAGAEGPATTAVTSAVSSEPQTADLAADEHALDTDAARREALASLDTLDGASLKPQVPAAGDAAPVPVTPMPVMSAASGVTSSGAGASEDTGTVPMRDYTGHEDMWAAALSILAEVEEAPVQDAYPAAPAYVGKHLRMTTAMTQPTPVPPSPERAAAVDEGARATERHTHVNDLIEEEFDQVPSTSVRRASHEYLKVIQGGTASMPRLRAEA